jgi:hypothetical protein
MEAAMLENTFLQRVLCKLAAAMLLPLALVWGCWNTAAGTRASTSAMPEPELPMQWEGRPLRPLALSEVERRFARNFPGSIARLTDGHDVLVLRTVQRPTRMLHPAVDCYRALGWRIGAQQLQEGGDGLLWRCFEVERDGRRLRVCERIADLHGGAFTDTSAWFWAAVLGQSNGPWQALTVATPL